MYFQFVTLFIGQSVIMSAKFWRSSFDTNNRKEEDKWVLRCRIVFGLSFEFKRVEKDKVLL
jgi:hypothetical protein